MLQMQAPASIFDPPPVLYDLRTQPLKVLARVLNYTVNLLRAPPPKSSTSRIRIVCISDTHCLQTSQIPDGDVLIHAGDLTNAGTPAEIQAQIDWLESLPHQHKIAIAGNHDTYLDPRSRKTLKPSDQAGSIDWKSLTYLQHSAITLTLASRSLKIYGAPQIPACGPDAFAFQYARGSDAWTDTIPADIDVLVTHTPPKFHFDLSASLGCEHLLREVWKVRPRLHVFGHVHAGRSDLVGALTDGREVVWWDKQQRCLEAVLQRSTEWLGGALNPGCWVGLLGVLVYGILGVVWDRIWKGEDFQPTEMVLASLMYCNTNQLGNRAQVVDI